MVQKKTLFLLSLMVIFFSYGNSSADTATMKIMPVAMKATGHEPTSIFGLRDLVVLQVEGCGDKNVLVKVYDGKGDVVDSQERFLHKKAMDADELVTIKASYFDVKTVSQNAGHYSASLYVDNKRVATCDFTVVPKAP